MARGSPPTACILASSPPASVIATQERAAWTNMLRTAQKMAEDIRALKANVEALRGAQSQTAKDATTLEGLKSRLEAVNTETGASIAEPAGKVKQMQCGIINSRYDELQFA
jgi:hypothetical protein